MGETTESPLDAIQGRAKALGWKTERDTFTRGSDEWLDVATPSGGHVHYRTRDGVLSDLVGSTGAVCRHDRALLERDGEAMDILRSLTAQAEEMRAALDRMDADIVRLQALVVGCNG